MLTLKNMFTTGHQIIFQIILLGDFDFKNFEIRILFIHTRKKNLIK